MLGCGPSKLIADGDPISTSTVPGRPRVHPDGAIAERTILSFGEASTSATLRCPATAMSMPVETSDCGSRSTTRVETPLAKAADASPSVTVVFPTPPLRELTLSTCTNREPTFTNLKEPTSSRPRATAASQGTHPGRPRLE